MKRNVFRYLSVYCCFIRCHSSQHDCFRMDSGGITEICCDNYVRKNGVCVECATGMRSKNEEPCLPCSTGTYGRQCNKFCRCNIDERCDRVIGCVPYNNVSTMKAKTDVRMILSTSKQNNNKTSAYSPFTSAASIQNLTIEITKVTFLQDQEDLTHIGTDVTVQHKRTSIDMNADKTLKKEPFTKREIVVYSVGSSCVLLLIGLLCFGFLWFYKYKRKHFANSLIARTDSLTRSKTSDDAEEGSLYDSINEDEIYDDNIQIIYSQENKEVIHNQTSESDQSSPTSENSGYLHPYTTVSKDSEAHVYCKKINSYDSSSLSSVSDDTKRDSGYTHPYQQLQIDQESKPDYSKIVHYFELIDITKTSCMGRSSSNKTTQSSSKETQQNRNAFKAFSPLFSKNHIPRSINRNACPRNRSLDFPSYSKNKSVLTASYCSDKKRINDGVSPDYKHISV